MIYLTVISTVLGIIGAVFATPFGQTWTSRYMRRIKQERALARLKQIPEYKIGTWLEFYTPDVGGGSSRFGDVWTLVEMKVGRVLLLSHKTGHYFPLTCQEFEAGSVVVHKNA